MMTMTMVITRKSKRNVEMMVIVCEIGRKKNLKRKGKLPLPQVVVVAAVEIVPVMT